MKNISIFLGRRFITNIIITFFAFVLNEPLVFGAQNAGATQPDDEIKMVVEKIYNLVLPIAVAIAVIKLLIALFTLATSQGDPGKLNNV
ncbi:MAG TPA: hypothetical protein ENJ78_00745, partial [candidate division WWE3 bacterium]|nr:hypothetical protein [candidate division WWE3 bacterium]